MNEGIGSTVVIAIIVVFIALVSGYMAYNVNYTKAFRMKNKIVSTIEKYEGVCDSKCEKDIQDYADEIGYRPMNENFCNNHTAFVPEANKIDSTQYVNPPGYCLYKVAVRKTTDDLDIVSDYNHDEGYYYRVLTIINIRVPIIQNWMQFNYVSGDTKAFFHKV